MGHGLFTQYTATMASAGTLTSEIDFGRVYGTVYLEVPSMTSNSEHYVQAARASGGTYRRVYHPAINDSTVTANNAFAIHSSVTNALVPLPNGLRYVKVETTATVDSGGAYYFHCSDE